MSRFFGIVMAFICLSIGTFAQEVRDLYVAPRTLFPFDPLTDRYEPRSLTSVATYIEAWRDEGARINLHISTANFSRGTLLYLELVDSSLLDRVMEFLDADFCKDTTDRILSEKIYDFPQSRDFLLRFATDIERIKNFYSTPLCRLDSALVFDPYAPCSMSSLMHDFQLYATHADVSLFAPTVLNMTLDTTIYIRQIDRIFPFDNQLVVVSMNGMELKSLLEDIYGARFYSLRNEQSDLLNFNLPTSMHQCVAGVSFSVNLTRSRGHRIEHTNIIAHKVYRVALNSFTASKLSRPSIEIGDYKTLFIKYLRLNRKPSSSQKWDLRPERWVDKIKQRENLHFRNL